MKMKDSHKVTQNGIKEAVEAFSRAIELDPNYTFAYVNRAWAYIELKKYQKVIANCNRALALDPNYAFAYAKRGLALNPNDAAAYNGRGYAYQLLIPMCVQSYNTEVRNAHLSVVRLNAHWYQAVHYQRAIQDYDRALALDPNFSYARDKREEVYRLLKG